MPNKTMEKEFVPYELALRLGSLGFDEPCFGYYETQDKNLVINFNNLPLTEEQKKRPGLYTIYNRNSVLPQWAVTSPTWSSAFQWFREKYGYLSYIKEATKGTCRFYIEKFDEKFFNSDIIDTYEEAELACLKKLIEINRDCRTKRKVMDIDEKQKLIDLMFSMVMAATSDEVFCKRPRGERMAWVANNLRDLGYDTHPVGMSWGALVGPRFRETNEVITDNLQN